MTTKTTYKADDGAGDPLYAAPLLSADEEMRLFRAYRASGDPAIREKLILANTRLAREWAHKFHPRGAMTYADIEQEAMIGLMTAIERFEPERGNKFSTMATWWIRQAITRALGDKAEMIREPIHVQTKRAAAIRRGEEASVAPRRRVYSLDTPTLSAYETDDPDGTALKEMIPAPDSEAFTDAIAEDDAEARLRQTLCGAIAMLSDREQAVIARRFGLASDDGSCWTLEKCGAHMGITRERVRQIEAHAMTALRKWLKQTPDGEVKLHGFALLAARRRAAFYRQPRGPRKNAA